MKQQVPPLYKALCSAWSHVPSLLFSTLVSTLLSLYSSTAFLADRGRIADIHPNSAQSSSKQEPVHLLMIVQILTTL